MLFVSGGYTSEVLDTIEEALNAVAFPIEGVAEAGLPASVLLGRDVRRGAFGLNGAAKPVGVVCLVGEHDGSGLQPGEQVRRLRTVAGLAGSDREFQGYRFTARRRNLSAAFRFLRLEAKTSITSPS